MAQDSSKTPNGDQTNGPAAFLRRLRQNVTETVAVSRPVPGLVKLKQLENSTTTSVSSFLTSTFRGSGTAKETSKETSKDHSLPISSIPHAPRTPTATPAYRITQFEQLLFSDNVDLNALRKLSWNGIPAQFRTMAWQLMLGYLPTNKSRRDAAIARKRNEYKDAVVMYYDVADSDRTTQDGEILRQILVDLPRTCPHSPLYQQRQIQKSMERILYVWSIRHPASGYVQGMNDLLTPLVLICLSPFTSDVLRCDMETIDANSLFNMEADSYWCLTKLLDNIQDHYTFGQPGLQRMMLRLEDLVHRIDGDLDAHFQAEGIQYMQFSFRWMNCLLLRELPLRAILRIWDTYLAEENGGFENFHVYVCVVLLKTFEEKLKEIPFQELLMFLQELPTAAWCEDDVEPILSQAYILSTLFENSPNHLS